MEDDGGRFQNKGRDASNKVLTTRQRFRFFLWRFEGRRRCFVRKSNLKIAMISRSLKFEIFDQECTQVLRVDLYTFYTDINAGCASGTSRSLKFEIFDQECTCRPCTLSTQALTMDVQVGPTRNPWWDILVLNPRIVSFKNNVPVKPKFTDYSTTPRFVS
jgi:hypothetical protein